MKTFREFQDEAAHHAPFDTYAKINKWAADQYANQMIEYRRQHLNQLLESHGLKLVVLQSGEWDLEQTVKTIKI